MFSRITKFKISKCPEVQNMRATPLAAALMEKFRYSHDSGKDTCETNVDYTCYKRF